MTDHVKEAAVGVKRVLLDLQSYAQSQAVNQELGRDVDALVATGALSAESAVFIRRPGVEFFGFDSQQVDPGGPVLQISVGGTTPAHLVIGFRDGHVECRRVRGNDKT